MTPSTDPEAVIVSASIDGLSPAEARDRLRALAAENAALRAEVERLREALDLLRGAHINWYSHEDSERFAALTAPSRPDTPPPRADTGA